MGASGAFRVIATATPLGSAPRRGASGDAATRQAGGLRGRSRRDAVCFQIPSPWASRRNGHRVLARRRSVHEPCLPSACALKDRQPRVGQYRIFSTPQPGHRSATPSKRQLVPAPPRARPGVRLASTSAALSAKRRVRVAGIPTRRSSVHCVAMGASDGRGVTAHSVGGATSARPNCLVERILRGQTLRRYTRARGGQGGVA